MNHVRIRARFVKNRFLEDNQPPPHWRWILNLPDGHLLRVVDSTAHVNIFVIGGEAGRSVILEGFGTPITQAIEMNG